MYMCVYVEPAELSFCPNVLSFPTLVSEIETQTFYFLFFPPLAMSTGSDF
jgi:hypothetical protein